VRISVIEWLLGSDPSIRWQVMRDLIGESDATFRVSDRVWPHLREDKTAKDVVRE
jgi:hypothetical protein